MAERALQETQPSTQQALTEGPLQIDLQRRKLQNGRRYHAFKEGAYLAVFHDQRSTVNDASERMDLVHHIYRLLLGGRLHLAPIKPNPQRVLDLGTGTGIWAMDFADEYPSTEVLGTDLSPIQPKWVPPNCLFEVDDYESEWVYSRPFDFIHARELEGCIADDDRLFQQAFRHLKSGGYIELQAVSPYLVSDDDTAEKAKTVQLWVKTLREGGKRFGKPFDNVDKWKSKLEKAGFVDVKETIYKLPIGTWPKHPGLKEIGKYQFIGELQAVETYTPALFSRVLGWSHEEIKALIAKVKKELTDPGLHLYLPTHFIYGRKP
ncbi:hypothetical protein T310_10074 [Rasamsonia emersonii CBS 393.64]|uniref:UMTA methyltransferase family protein n=1 Tax=Rasamsonia emersonii (strain ATCC 16479 / CBS 393.64 / IMI 116815) TaxID=1408163 RepID=A0A0F4YDY0_RASE3|nr:hypothetical protein T310_10074 [Rasamsonia emersonii CBS 393.64]KKA16340.1 hypothetical protein T310_10074 [Rasamsonia emersonii CBS 393.64]